VYPTVERKVKGHVLKLGSLHHPARDSPRLPPTQIALPRLPSQRPSRDKGDTPVPCRIGPFRLALLPALR
jgi:hypothetical protein